MKAPSSSLYRLIEQLLFWAQVVVDRTPKTTSYGSLGKKVMFDMEESLDLVDLMLHTKDRADKLTYLNAISIRMRDVKTIFRLYRERSKRPAERLIGGPGKNGASEPGILSADQYSSFATQMFLIGKDLEHLIDSYTGAAVSADSRPED